MNNKKHDEDFFRTVYGDEELEKLKNMKKRYDAKVQDSFNTKWKLFLFSSIINKPNKSLDLESFINFKITEELVNKYTAEYWQSDRNDIIDEIYNQLKKLDLNQELKSLCKTHYKNNFEDVFSFSDFSELNKADKCCYCNLTIEKVKKLANKKLLFKKNERGWNLEIDRKNSNYEYSKENCVMSCYWCNNAKTDEFTYDEFRKIGESFEIIWEARLRK
jgi:hypothetical protein